MRTTSTRHLSLLFALALLPALSAGGHVSRPSLVAIKPYRSAVASADAVNVQNETKAVAPKPNRPSLARRLRNWFEVLHSSAFARVLVTGCVYWMAFASYQMNRDMQLFTNPL